MKKNISRPVIGVNCVATYNPFHYEMNLVLSNYLQRIWAAGGFPLIIPSFMEDDGYQAEYLDQVDGVLFVGGPDYHPELYHEAADSHTDPARLLDYLDVFLEQKAERRGLPVLGICAGCQLICIAHGGRLRQHIPDAEKIHRDTFHQATMLKEGISAGILQVKAGEEFRVNSFHHQCVSEPGAGMQVMARGFDGTVEIIEGTGFTVGVQFHPERMDDFGPLFFGALVKKAAEYRAGHQN